MIDAVIFDWGGTLTRWHDIDFHAESLALAAAVVATPDKDDDRHLHARALHEAGAAVWGRSRDHQESATIGDLFDEAGLQHDPELLSAYYEFWVPHTETDPEVRPLWEWLRAEGIKVGVLSNTIWGRSRDHQQSATIADLFTVAGLDHDPELLTAYYEFWVPHTETDPEVRPLWEWLRAEGIKVGVLSNTVWPREWHVGFFERDGVAHLIDGDVYTSEIPWTKPSPRAFAAAMEAVGASDAARCVYVGDRLYDDVWGARNAGMRTIHIPHSAIPADQVGHTEGEPDAVAGRLSEIPDLIDNWR